jgi:hypothetical protein
MNQFSIPYVRRILFTISIPLSISVSCLVVAQQKRPSEIVAADGTKLRYVVEGSGIPCVVVNPAQRAGAHFGSRVHRRQGSQLISTTSKGITDEDVKKAPPGQAWRLASSNVGDIKFRGSAT